MLRAKIISWLAVKVGLPKPYFELLPMEPKEFDDLDRSLIGFPVVMNWTRMQEAIWPKPDHPYRVYIRYYGANATSRLGQRSLPYAEEDSA